MNEHLKIIDYKYKVIISTFVFFLLIGFLAPLSGSDWEFFNKGSAGISILIDNMVTDFRSMKGDFLVNFLLEILTNNKFIFNVLYAFTLTMFISSTVNIIGNIKNKYYYIVPLGLLLLVSTYTFSYNFLSVKGFVTSTLPAILSICYLVTIYRNKGNFFGKGKYLSFILLSMFIPLLSKEIGFSFLFANLVFYFYKLFKEKKINIKYLILIVLTLVSFIFYIHSNGFIFYLDDFYYSSSRFINTTFTGNIILVIAMAMPINYYLHDKLKERVYSRLIIILFDFILVFTFICYIQIYAPVNINLVINTYSGIFSVDKWYYMIYFVLYILLFIKSIYYIIKSNELSNFMFILLLTSISTVLFSLFTSNYDRGSEVLFILIGILLVTILIKEMSINLGKYLTITVGILFVYYIAIFAIVKYIDTTRNNYIKEQLDAGSNIVEIKANPLYLTYLYNPRGKNVEEFKKFYNIPEEVHIKVKYFGIFEKIEKEIKK